MQVECAQDIMNIKTQKGQVVLFSGSGLESGLGKDLFLEWSQDEKNLLLFTGNPPPGTLGRQLADNLDVSVAGVDVKRKVPLQGAKLAAFQAERRRAKQEERAAKAALLAVGQQSHPLFTSSPYVLKLLLPNAPASVVRICSDRPCVVHGRQCGLACLI
jgi:Cft2 family RNA processing exonuclease